jgi:malate synthase
VAAPTSRSRADAVVRGPQLAAAEGVLTPAARAFIAELTRAFRPRLRELLRERVAAQAARDAGRPLGFDPATAAVRRADWRVAPAPRDLEQRTVEITGPVDRKMVINALNSGADVFMADFEDATAPTFENLVSGQANLVDAARRRITFDDPASGKHYALNAKTATLLVRPRGLHLPEAHVLVDDEVVPGPLFDLGIYLFLNARELLDRGTGPYFYLPKLESYLEARWWNEVIAFAEDALRIPRGSAKATVLIETLPAAFCMDEILFELRDHVVGLNCGRWDYIFSFIKARRADPGALLPDRGQVTMAQPFMRAYTQLLVKTCHRRGAHAMGGMAAQIPIKNDARANEEALAKVRADKLREVTDGHDGTWVAHPGLVEVAREVFAKHMKGSNQLGRLREDVAVAAEDLLAVPGGTRTEAGLRHNVRVGIHYLEAWLSGTGCVPLYHLMEDAATAEISRAQIWQWLKHGAALDSGKTVTHDLVARVIDDEMGTIRSEVGADRFAGGRYDQARELFAGLCFRDSLTDFLTLEAYELLRKDAARA